MLVPCSVDDSEGPLLFRVEPSGQVFQAWVRPWQSGSIAQKYAMNSVVVAAVAVRTVIALSVVYGAMCCKPRRAVKCCVPRRGRTVMINWERVTWY